MTKMELNWLAQRSWDMLQIHSDLDQDKAVTGDESMNPVMYEKKKK